MVDIFVYHSINHLKEILNAFLLFAQLFLRQEGCKLLSDFERDQILAYKIIGMSLERIAVKSQRSKTIIFNFLQNPTTYGTEKCTGRT